ncbi:MAG TPA: SDR family oxidoreductase [Pirellulales bacterium]|nr:SDR family oxidoreductase [Pirellulales bacterium]
MSVASTTSPNSSARVVLITGISSGIGKACAEHLAARGWRVFGTLRTAGPAAAGVETIVMDVDSDASVARGVDEVLSSAGRLDAVVNNAGFALMGAVEDTSTAEAQAQFETNFFGVLRVCRAALPIMRRQGAGAIVNISSLAAVQGLPFSGLYSASKFALEGLSESLRLETRHLGIRIMLVEPGDFRTAITQKRRFAAASATHDAYAATFDRAKRKQDTDETNAPPPQSIALLVERILNHPRPKLRYSVGMLSQRIVVPLKSYLPQCFYEWLLCRVLGI